MKKNLKLIILLILMLSPKSFPDQTYGIKMIIRPGEPVDFTKKLCAAAIERTSHLVKYDGSYRKITYPGGDVPKDTGVCTDLIIRTYRELGIDLQKLVYEDMKLNFSFYPKIWGLSEPDPNIDHRRVLNLRVFFKRKGTVLSISDKPEDYQPGDLVTWWLGGKLPHIGIVVNRISNDGKRFKIVHNIGEGPKVEDILFKYPISGHFRYYGSYSSTVKED